MDRKYRQGGFCKLKENMKTNKELKQEYKQKKPTMGVFQILNKVSGKVLVEGSTDISSKWNRHRTELRFGNHRNKGLQGDWNNVGEENFEFSIISNLDLDDNETLDVSKEVKTLEEMVVEELKIEDEMRY